MLPANKIYESIIFREKKYVLLGLLQRATCPVPLATFAPGVARDFYWLAYTKESHMHIHLMDNF